MVVHNIQEISLNTNIWLCMMHGYICSIDLATSLWLWLLNSYYPVTTAQVLPHERSCCMGKYHDHACWTGTARLIAVNSIHSISINKVSLNFLFYIYMFTSQYIYTYLQNTYLYILTYIYICHKYFSFWGHFSLQLNIFTRDVTFLYQSKPK